jgi:hypothetical protein
VSLTDWIASLHVLSAFALVAALVLFWTLYFVPGVDPSSPALMKLGRLGSIVVGVGFAGTIIFGVWLAIAREPYQLWDLWVIAALVLWAIGGWTGQRAGALAQEGQLRESMRFHAATSISRSSSMFSARWCWSEASSPAPLPWRSHGARKACCGSGTAPYC